MVPSTRTRTAAAQRPGVVSEMGEKRKSIKPARPSGLFSLLSVMTNVLVIVLCIAKDQRTYSFVRNLIMARGIACQRQRAHEQRLGHSVSERLP